MFANLAPAPVHIKLELGQLIPLAVRHGFAGIDLPLREIAGAPDPDAMAEQLRDAGLRWGGFGLPVDFRSDVHVFERDLEQLRAWAPIVQRVGCNRSYAWIRPGHNELDYQTHFKMLSDRLGRVVEIFSDHNVRLGLEFIGPLTLRQTFRYPFIHTIAQMLELCEAIQPPGAPPNLVGVLLDSFHWWTSGATESDLLEQLSNDRIVYVHVNDGYPGRNRDEQMDQERKLPYETGLIDASSFVGALRALDYDGPITAEPFMPELAAQQPHEIAACVADSINKMLNS